MQFVEGTCEKKNGVSDSDTSSITNGLQNLSWQDSAKTIANRNLYLLNNEKYCDCTFTVGSECNTKSFKVHKLILAAASPVFETMFFGSIPETSVAIPDVEPDIFEAMLVYIYTDNIDITNFNDLYDYLYAAEKYMLNEMKQLCINYLQSHVNVESACKILDVSLVYDNLDLMETCLQFISKNTLEVLTNDNFMDIALSSLLKIFDQDVLNINSELDLFNCLVNYARFHGLLSNVMSFKADEINGDTDSCTIFKKSPSNRKRQSDVRALKLNNDKKFQTVTNEQTECIKTPEINKRLLREAVKKIRFLTLTPEQFASTPAHSCLLTDSEKLSIFMRISSAANGSYPMPDGFSLSVRQR